MARSMGLLIVALAMLLPIIAGCGGSDSGTVIVPPGDQRIITGRIVRADTGAGLAEVLVRLGTTDKTAISGVSGDFAINYPKNQDLPAFLQVDTTSAGAAYPPGNVVTYNGQRFLPTYVDIPVSVLNGETDVFGNIGVYNASGDTPVPPPFASKDTIILGKVVSKKTSNPIEGVTVRFGPDRFYSGVSGDRGFFGVNLGRNVPVSSIYTGPTGSFQVDTTTAGASYPDTLPIVFRSGEYDQNAVVVPSDIMNGDSTNLGTLIVIDDGSGGGGPPPPPGG